MNGEYWFNTEPISKNVDVIFEKEKYQFINEVLHLLSIEEIKEIINNIVERVDDKRPYSFAKEYFSIRLDFGLCTIELELPNQSYSCYIEGNVFSSILEKYAYEYEHLDDRFKSL